MKLIVGQTELAALLKHVSTKMPGAKRRDHVLRLSGCAAHVFLESNQTVAGHEALVLEEGTCTVNLRVFADLVATYTNKPNLTIEANERYLQIVNSRLNVDNYSPSVVPPTEFKVFPVTDTWLAATKKLSGETADCSFAGERKTKLPEAPPKPADLPTESLPPHEPSTAQTIQSSFLFDNKEDNATPSNPLPGEPFPAGLPPAPAEGASTGPGQTCYDPEKQFDAPDSIIPNYHPEEWRRWDLSAGIDYMTREQLEVAIKVENARITGGNDVGENFRFFVVIVAVAAFFLVAYSKTKDLMPLLLVWALLSYIFYRNKAVGFYCPSGENWEDDAREMLKLAAKFRRIESKARRDAENDQS